MLKRNVPSLWQGDRSSIMQWGILDTGSSDEQCLTLFQNVIFYFKISSALLFRTFSGSCRFFMNSSKASSADKLVWIIQGLYINNLFWSYLFSSLINISVWSLKCDICPYKKWFFSSSGAGAIAQREGQGTFQIRRGWKRKADKRRSRFPKGERSLGEEQGLVVWKEK